MIGLVEELQRFGCPFQLPFWFALRSGFRDATDELPKRERRVVLYTVFLLLLG